MVDVFVERQFDPPLTAELLEQMFADSRGCLGLYRIDHILSLISPDMSRLVCRFSGPDAESVRTALRQAGADVSQLWPGTIHDAPGFTEDDVANANVLVQRHWVEPVAIEDIQAIENEGAWCLEAYNVKFIRTYFSTDRKSMICLYRAPDAESVRAAQRQADMPFDHIWAFKRL